MYNYKKLLSGHTANYFAQKIRPQIVRATNCNTVYMEKCKWIKTKDSMFVKMYVCVYVHACDFCTWCWLMKLSTSKASSLFA